MTEARARFSSFVEEVSADERFEITRRDRPAAVLLGADDYAALMETIAVLSSAKDVREIRNGLRDLKRSSAFTEDPLVDGQPQ